MQNLKKGYLGQAVMKFQKEYKNLVVILFLNFSLQELTLLKAWIFINKKIIIYIFRLNSLYRFLKWEFNSSYLGKKQYWWKNYCNCTRFNLPCWSWNFWAYLHRGFKIWIKSKLLGFFFWSFFNNKKFEFERLFHAIQFWKSLKF